MDGLGPDRYTWGRKTRAADPEGVRQQYLAALRHADSTGDHLPLEHLALS